MTNAQKFIWSTRPSYVTKKHMNALKGADILDNTAKFRLIDQFPDVYDSEDKARDAFRFWAQFNAMGSCD